MRRIGKVGESDTSLRGPAHPHRDRFAVFPSP